MYRALFNGMHAHDKHPNYAVSRGAQMTEVQISDDPLYMCTARTCCMLVYILYCSIGY